MELYKGLPLRTIVVDGNEYGVTTDTVDALMVHYFMGSDDEENEIAEFDNSYAYAVPQEIFEADEKTIINYIKGEIDKTL